MEDRQFINQFATVLGVLIGITVLILIIAKVLSDTHQEQDQAMQKAIAERIKPVGEVYIGRAPAAATAAQPPHQPSAQITAAQTADTQMSAADVYQAVCAVCHAAGVANAPIYGDKAAWAPRLSDIQLLYANSLNGKGAMPAKGGRPDLSDETIQAAVDYMLDAVR